MSRRVIAGSSSNRNSASALVSSVLPTPVGPRNRNEPIGRLGSLQAGAGAAHGVGDGDQGLVLADHALAQVVLHAQQLLALALEHLLDRHAGPAGDDGGDLLGVDHLGGERRPASASASSSARRFSSGRDLAVGDLRGALQVAAALGGGQLGAQAVQRLAGLGGLADLLLLGPPAGGHLGGLAPPGRRARPRAFPAASWRPRRVSLVSASRSIFSCTMRRSISSSSSGLESTAMRTRLAGLVDQVDGLVGQEAVGDVAVGEGGGGDDGAVGDAHAVVHLVLLLQAAQDRDGVLDRRLADEHRLEAAGQRRVLLDVLAVLVERGGADAVQLAAGQGGLQQVGGVHRPFGLAGADQGVHLVDEQDDRALGGGDLVQHRLQPLLELAAVLRAGDQRAHVERHQLLVLQALRHVAVDDAQGQALDDGGLADAGLADQHRVVLGAAGQHLDGAADLLVAADHRVELLVAGGLGEVAGVALQRVIAFLGRGGVGGAALADGVGGVLQARRRGAGVLQRLGRLAAFLGDGDQQALGGDEGVAGVLGVLFGLGEHAWPSRASCRAGPSRPRPWASWPSSGLDRRRRPRRAGRRRSGSARGTGRPSPPAAPSAGARDRAAGDGARAPATGPTGSPAWRGRNRGRCSWIPQIGGLAGSP